MLVLSRKKGETIMIGGEAGPVTVTVAEVNRWRWWRFWVEPTVVLKVEGPEGTTAWPREKFDAIRNET